MTDSIFTGLTPDQLDQANPTPITLGMVFYPTVDGTITHIRWYAPFTPSDAPPVGRLWRFNNDDAGTILATRQGIPSPVGGGWVQAALDAPVPVVAGQKYVVGVRAIRYCATNDFFATSDHVSGNLVAPANAAGLRNGRFADNDTVGDPPSYPTQEFRASAYFVDVAFEPAVAPPPGDPIIVADSAHPLAVAISPPAEVVIAPPPPPPPPPPPGTPDQAIMPMLKTLLDVYRAESAKVPDPPKYASIRPGVAFVAGQSVNGQGEVIADEAMEGAIWLRQVNAYPTRTFPAQDTGFQHDLPGSLAVVVEMGIVRCIPFQDDADNTMPSSAQHIGSAQQLLADQAAMYRAACEMRKRDFDVVIGQYQPIPSDSYAGGGTLHLTVRVPFCYCS